MENPNKGERVLSVYHCQRSVCENTIRPLWFAIPLERIRVILVKNVGNKIVEAYEKRVKV